MRIGRVSGIPISVHWSWLLGFVFITWTVAGGNLPFFPSGLTEAQQWIIAGFVTLSLFGSVLMHELAHSLTAKRLGYEVSGITLLIFGGVSLIPAHRSRAGHDFMIAFAGPLMSLVLGIMGIAFLWILGSTDSGGLRGIFEGWLGYLGLMNIALAIFNMLPGIPLDGGRVLQAAVWGLTGNRDLASRVAAFAGRAVSALIFVYAFYLIFVGNNVTGGIWLFLIGLFMASAATMESRTVEERRRAARRVGVSVSQAMSPAPTALDGDAPLDAAVRNVLRHYPDTALPVVSDGRISGFITLDEVASLGLMDPSEQSGLTVADAAGRSSTGTVTPEMDLSEAIEEMRKRKAERLLVFQGDRLVGTLGRDDISAAMAIDEK